MKFYDWLGVDAISSNPSSDDSDVPELDEESDVVDPKDHVSTR